MRKILFYSLFLLVLFSCTKETNTTQPIPEPVPSGKTPVIFVHGFLASGDTYEKQTKRFTSNGYSLADLYAFDWNSLGGTTTQQDLDKLVNEVLAKTGKKAK